MLPRAALVLLVSVFLTLGLACGGDASSSLPTTSTPALTFTPTSTPVVTSTPIPTATPSPTATSSPTPTIATGETAESVQAAAEEGWTLYDKSADGFRLALPPGWDEIELDAETTSGLIETAADENPQLAGVYERLNEGDVNYSFFAFDFTPEAMASNSCANVNVLTMPLPVKVSLDVYVRVSIKQVENMNLASSPIAHERVKTEWGEMERLEYSMTVGDNQPPQTIIQFVTISDEVAYVLTMAVFEDQAGAYASTFDKIGRSFEPAIP